MTQLPHDPSRRRFFRSFAGDVVAGAAQALGAMEVLRSQAAHEATELFSDPLHQASSSTGGGLTPDIAGGFRRAFRYGEPARLLVIDQRKLPGALAEVPVESASEAAWIIRDLVVQGAPAVGQVAAIGLALSAARMADSPTDVIRAVLEGSANALRSAQPTAANLRVAVDRMMDRLAALDPDVAGATIAVALRAEAARIVAEATEDHERLAATGLTILPDPHGRPAKVLTHGSTGHLAGGQSGTALGVLEVAHLAGRQVHVWVGETRPSMTGTRLTSWELALAGVPHTLVPDAAAGHLLARGEVDAIMVGAERVAANGDTANSVGTYPLAVLAGRHGIPFYVCAPLSSIDVAIADGMQVAIDEGSANDILSDRGERIAPPDTSARNPGFDITPAELITGIVTDEGVLRAPYGPALEAAIERRAVRRAAANQVGSTPP